MIFRTHQLTVPTMTHGTSGMQVASFQGVPVAEDGKPLYLNGILVTNLHTPTFTNQPTRVQTLNALAISFFDGTRYVFNGLNGNHFRYLGMLANGRQILPDVDTDGPASTAARYVKSVYWHSDPRFESDDFAIPVAQLVALNGKLEITPAALANIGADTTAATSAVTVTLLLSARDEVVLPAEIEIQCLDFNVRRFDIGGEGHYIDLALFNSSAAFDAITAGDFGNITVRTGRDVVHNAVPAHDLTAAFWAAWGVGQFSDVRGDPADASEDPAKTVQNGASNTAVALAATAATMQPVLYAVPFGRNPAHITQLPFVPNALGIEFSALQAGTSMVMYRRIVRPDDSRRANALRAVEQKLGLPASQTGRIKTKSGKPFRGGIGAGKFLPVKAQYGRR